MNCHCSQTSPNLQNKTDLSSASVFVTFAYDEADFPLRPNKFPSWLRLKRVLAWVNRFIGNSSKRSEHRLTGELLSDELKQVEIQLVKFKQITEFREEWKAQSNKKSLPLGSKLLGLNPKIDDDA